jgi:hypothetical protein
MLKSVTPKKTRARDLAMRREMPKRGQPGMIREMPRRQSASGWGPAS